jgi:hypothetical protein
MLPIVIGIVSVIGIVVGITREDYDNDYDKAKRPPGENLGGPVN